MKLSSYVVLKKEVGSIGINVWRAYWRGTSNRIKRDNGQEVSCYMKQTKLRFDLLNNPMEHGVLI